MSIPASPESVDIQAALYDPQGFLALEDAQKISGDLDLRKYDLLFARALAFTQARSRRTISNEKLIPTEQKIKMVLGKSGFHGSLKVTRSTIAEAHLWDFNPAQSSPNLLRLITECDLVTSGLGRSTADVLGNIVVETRFGFKVNKNTHQLNEFNRIFATTEDLKLLDALLTDSRKSWLWSLKARINEPMQADLPFSRKK